VTESLPKAYKPWLIASLVILVGSLVLLAIAVTAAFWTFADQTTPLWAVVLGVLSLLGIALGFGGLFLMLVAAGYKSFREGRRVQILPPERTSPE
jgi:uncharacterized membrane protein YqhA